MIYDCFTFFNELDVLEMRLEELYPVVDKFFIVEGSHTFQGQPKPEYAWTNHKRFEKWMDKIVFCRFDFTGNYASAWEREYAQRNHTKECLQLMDVQDNDIILLSDADEIPRRADLEKAIAGMDNFNVRSLGLDAYYYGTNVDGGHQHTNRIARWGYAKNMTMQELRTLDPPPNVIEHAGWHFSYLGDAEHIANKFRAFAHSELNRADTTDHAILVERMKAHKDLWGDGHQYTQVEIDDTWPEAIKNNRDYWRKYEW